MSLSAHPVEQSQKQTPSGGSDELRDVSEGAACVRVVADASPGEMGGYYSEKMRLNRDLLVLGVAAHLVAMSSRMKKARTPGGDPVRVLDAFAASGLAGIRVVLEAPALAEALEKKRQREEETELEGKPAAAAATSAACSRMTVGEPEEKRRRTESFLSDVRSAAAGVSADAGGTVAGVDDGDFGEFARRRGRPLAVVLNDLSQAAVDLASGNVAQNSVSARAEVTRRRADALLYDVEHPFDFVHLDPFGTVVPHLDSAMSRAPHLSVLGLTATDISTLYCAYPAVARRMYAANVGSKPRHPCFREFGARLLLAAAARSAARHGRGVEPVVSVSKEHFIHVQVRLRKGAAASDAAVDNISSIRHCTTCNETGIEGGADLGCTDAHGASHRTLGPVWTGPLFDPTHVCDMRELACSDEGIRWFPQATRGLLDTLALEARVDSLFTRRPQSYAREIGANDTARLSAVEEELRRRQINASRTHFDSQGLRTMCTRQEFVEAVQKASHREAPREMLTDTGIITQVALLPNPFGDDARFTWIVQDAEMRLASMMLPSDSGDASLLACGGITHVVSVVEDRVECLDGASLALQVLHLPVVDFTAPSQDQLVKAVRFILGAFAQTKSSEEKEERKENAVAVHCFAGLGRTGTVVSCALVAAREMSPLEAIECVRERRPNSVITHDQVQAVIDFEETWKDRSR